MTANPIIMPSAEVIGFGVEKLIGQIRQAGEHIKILLVSPILLLEKKWETGI